MKKIIITMATALALVSCSQDDLMQGVENRADGAIGVKPYVPTITRGTAVNSEGDLIKAGNGFDLFAFVSSDEPFMGTATDGVAFINSEDTKNEWDYKNKAEMKFWSQADGKEIQFYAVSPMSENTNTEKLTSGSLVKNITVASQTVEYTVPTTCSEQVDLMYAVPEAYSSEEESGDHIKNGITLPFRHALSQILFSAKTETEYVYAEIESVKIKNLYKKGTFNLKNGEAYRTDSEGTFPWVYDGDTDGKFDAALTLTKELNTDADGNTSATEGKYTASVEGENALPLIKSSEALLLLPQNLKTNGAALEVSCKVQYKRSDNDKPYIIGSETEYKTISVPVNTDWKPGFKYTYTLIFSAEMGNPIKVGTVAVDEWNNATDKDMNIEDGTEKPASTLALPPDYSFPEIPFTGGTETVTLTSESDDPLTIEYSTDGEGWTKEKPQDMSWVTISPKVLEISTFATGASTTFTYDITVGESSAALTEDKTITYILQTNTLKGSDEAPWDLSMHDIYGIPSKQNTANCYVVNAAGTYKFPVMVGNAKKDGVWNYEAGNNEYGPESVRMAENMYLKVDKDMVYDKSITKAELIWADAEGVIEDVKLVNANDKEKNCITFKVNEENIKECNAVIGIIGPDGMGGDNEKIWWSWHIWITAVDLRPVTINSYSYMPVNVGWISDGTTPASVYGYPSRDCKVRFTQGEKEVVINVKQSSYCCVEGNNSGSQPYYQWGRKDPLRETNDKYKTSSERPSFWDAVYNPSTFYISNNAIWMSYLNINADAWDAQFGIFAENADGSGNTSSMKTIFDPCPVGFAVAPSVACSISDMTSAGSGWTVTGEGGRKAYFPATSLLKMANGQKDDENSTNAYFWSSAWKNSSNIFIGMCSGSNFEQSVSIGGDALPVRAVAIE